MIGIELVKDKKTKRPATDYTAKLQQKCLKDGLFFALDGNYQNNIVIAPPLTITKQERDKGIRILENNLK